MEEIQNTTTEAMEPKARGRKPGTVRERLAARTAAPQHREEREVPRTEPERLKRGRKVGTDNLFIDTKMIPPGITYEWKRESIFGKPDQAYQIGLKENHWKPVPANRHPNIVVNQDGLRLMERPTYLCEEAKEEMLQEALRRLDGAANQLNEAPAGQFQRGGSPGADRATKLYTEYGHEIPE